ncbi:MAG TPA: cytochrome c, partial [Candidatus Acidoferrales bacterium]
KVELPEGEGKSIAVEYCQDCHRLTNLVKSHKSPEDWRETVDTMVDRGARLPPEDEDSLVKYLSSNFGPKKDAPAGPDTAAAATAMAPTQGAAPAPAPTPALSTDASSVPAATDAAQSAPAPAKKVELPEGDGKAIATENCQACHKLTNLTKAHKSLDEWRDTVNTMIDRGADIPADKIETLVQYLAKNFGPKPAAAEGVAPVGGTATGSSAPTK